MRTTVAVIFVSALLFAGVAAGATTTAASGPESWSDAAFMSASECAGLAEGSKLDVAAIKAKLKIADRDRMPYVADRADELRSDSMRRASHATGEHRQAIDAKLAGDCQFYLKD